jgi:hypothetical protein
MWRDPPTHIHTHTHTQRELIARKSSPYRVSCSVLVHQTVFVSLCICLAQYVSVCREERGNEVERLLLCFSLVRVCEVITVGHSRSSMLCV